MEHSAKIDSLISECEEVDGFWDFAHGYKYPGSGYWDMGLWDETWYSQGVRAGEEIPRSFENGYKLAKKAGDRPVFYIDRTDSAYYFIGEEDEIVAKITKIWAKELLDNPPLTEEEKEERQKARLRKKIEEKKAKLEQELKELG
jgi:hypothetical protein